MRPVRIANLGDVLVRLRKHGRGISASGRREQVRSSRAAAAAALRRRLAASRPSRKPSALLPAAAPKDEVADLMASLLGLGAAGAATSADPPKPPPLKKEKEDKEEEVSESKVEEAAIDERLVAVLQDGAGAIPPPTGPEIERAIEVIEALRDDCLARWGGATAAAEAVAVEEEDAESVRRRAACRAVQADAAGRRAELVTCAMSVEGPEAQRVWRKYGMQTVAALKGAA